MVDYPVLIAMLLYTLDPFLSTSSYTINSSIDLFKATLLVQHETAEDLCFADHFSAPEVCNLEYNFFRTGSMQSRIQKFSYLNEICYFFYFTKVD